MYGYGEEEGTVMGNVYEWVTLGRGISRWRVFMRGWQKWGVLLTYLTSVTGCIHVRCMWLGTSAAAEVRYRVTDVFIFLQYSRKDRTLGKRFKFYFTGILFKKDS